MIVPHFCKRGPNGLWIISRAVNHPLEQAFREQTLYYLRTERYGVFMHEIDDARKIYSLELFRSRRQADECAAAGSARSNLNIDVAVATGNELLRLISSVDVIEIGTTRVAITRDGILSDNRIQPLSPEDLLALIDANERSSHRRHARRPTDACEESHDVTPVLISYEHSRNNPPPGTRS
jgi:hypothetical protein